MASERRKIIRNINSSKRSDPILIEFDNATFQCVPKLPGLTFLDFVEKMDESHQTAAAGALRDFIFNSLDGDDQREAFQKFASDPENDVSLDVLNEVVSYLVEQYAGVGSGKVQQTPGPDSGSPQPYSPGYAPSGRGYGASG